MDISFADPRMRDTVNDKNRLQREFGADNAKRIRRRLDDLRAATCLQDLINGPGQLHALGGERKGQYAMRLVGGWRLVFEPADDPLPLRQDGGVDLHRVLQIRILEIVDYHRG